MKLLEDKVALITGAAAGIGAGVAHLFAEQGAKTYILDINGAGAQSVRLAIEAKGGFARAFEGDVRRPETIVPAVEDAIGRFDRIDILINNAGAFPRQSFLDMTEAQWDDIQNLNLKGIFHCTKVVLPHMLRRGSGKIVNMSSVTFYMGLENLSHYIAAKGGIIGFTRALAREFGRNNIHINCITPGAIQTEGEQASTPKEQLAEILKSQCLQRRIVPLDIARACLFLSSELSDGMTGQSLNVDGGLVMH